MPPSSPPEPPRRTLRLRAGALGAVLAAALAIFGALAAVVVSGPTPGIDRAVQEVAVDAETGWIAWLADGPFEEIADPTYMAPVAIVAAVVMAWLRWPVAAFAVLLGVAVAGLGGSEMKELIGRERPVDRISDAGNEAFPSGHSRFSVLWTVFAVAVAAHVPLRPRARWALIAAGVALTVVAGLSRIYLRAHWLTDVLGGWSFAIAAFAGAALLAMLLYSRRATR